MKLRRDPACFASGFIAASAFVCCLLFASSAIAQYPAASKRVVVLYWYHKDYPYNLSFDQSFKASLHSVVSEPVEYYAEYLETNRFPKDQQYALMRDYLRQKYSEQKPDVVVATSDVSLDFLLKYRSELFPNAPLVFVATRNPRPEDVSAGAGMTGIISINAYQKTLDLALKLHPDTSQVFIVSGTLDHDKRIENLARAELQPYENRVSINYLTDISPHELVARINGLPKRSIVLYVWQQAQNEQSQVVESMDILGSIAKSDVPIYKLSTPSYGGPGVIGGYINTSEANGAKIGEIVLRILNGTRPRDIPIESAPTIPEFDWRELQRWSISESKLPPDSVIRFRQVTFWSQYKWRIIGAFTVILIEALLIAGLLFERTRGWRAIRRLAESEDRYRNVVETQTDLICRYLPDTTLTFVNDAYCRYFGKSRSQLIGSKFVDLIPTHHQDAAMSHVQSLIRNPRTEINEHEVIKPDGSIGWQQWIDHVISSKEPLELQGIGRDVTELRMSLLAIQESEERFSKAFKANPQPMSLTTVAEGRYLDVNDSFLRMSGYTRDEVIGHTSAELKIFEVYEDRQRVLVQPLHKSGMVRNAELKFRIKDGTFRILLSSAELIELGGQKCILVASSDITERKESERRLAELTGRLLKTQDEERRRIARELHDVTAQNIGLIMLNLAQVRNAASMMDQRNKDRLTESLSLGEQALQEIRTLSYVLHPPLLDQAGLVTALRWYVKGFSERSGIRVSFDEDGTNGYRMPSEVEYALFRVVQECLTNIRRHTNSEAAEITLQREPENVLLSVHDHGTPQIELTGNGDGFEGLGVGIPGMRHRLRQLGGELSVDAGTNGTTVTAMVPVRWVIHDSSIVSG